MGKKPRIAVQDVNEAVKEAGDIPKLTEKQRKKLEQREKQYWDSMITRREAYEMVESAVKIASQQNKLLLLQVQTLTKFLVEKRLTTMDELNELSKSVADELYGKPPELEEKEKKEEGSEE